MVEPHSSNFKMITTNFLGVRIFRIFTVCMCMTILLISCETSITFVSLSIVYKLTVFFNRPQILLFDKILFSRDIVTVAKHFLSMQADSFVIKKQNKVLFIYIC